MDEHNDTRVVALPTWALGALLAAAGLGGGGLYGFVGPTLDREALTQCFDNSAAALAVAAQHGREFATIKREITTLRDALYERTALRYTADDAAADRRKQLARDTQQDRMIDLLEREAEQQ